jgi:RHS repeat-associated protein
LGVGPFTGKELDSETNLQYFGARYYMAALGRWGAVDPLADQYAGHSPYNYVLGNPLSFIDPDGRQVAGCPCWYRSPLVAAFEGYMTAPADPVPTQPGLYLKTHQVGPSGMYHVSIHMIPETDSPWQQHPAFQDDRSPGRGSFGAGPSDNKRRLVTSFNRDRDLEQPGQFTELDLGEMTVTEAIGMVMAAIDQVGHGDIGRYNMFPAFPTGGLLGEENSAGPVRRVLDITGFPIPDLELPTPGFDRGDTSKQ